MFIKGKYTVAIVTIDDLDQETYKQIIEFVNHEAFTNPVVVMPDTHAGKGAVIGFTMLLPDKVIPNVIGVDKGCGMLSYCIGQGALKDLVPQRIDGLIREVIPFGTDVNHEFNETGIETVVTIVNSMIGPFIDKFNEKFDKHYPQRRIDKKYIENKSKEFDIDYVRVVKSLGSLGGGNHFIEVGESTITGDNWITVHSGSRQFGLKSATYHQRKAGKHPLSYLMHDDMFEYLVDLLIAQTYAFTNRLIMMTRILNALDIKHSQVKDTVSSVHNFIDFHDFIIRKGAIASRADEKIVIPFNMEDGTLICKGKGNADWNYSAPHGAGRIGSRKWAKENLSNEDAKKRMDEKGIYCSRLPTDELKGAYKDPKFIEDAIEPTAEIIDRIRPIISCKE